MYRTSLGDIERIFKLLADDPVLLILLSIILKSFIIKELDDFQGFGNRREMRSNRNKKLQLYASHTVGTNRVCLTNWELSLGNLWGRWKLKDIKFFRVAIWHIYGIHTYISLTLEHLYLNLYSVSDFGPEVCKKC